jgi:hypothetical protein
MTCVMRVCAGVAVLYRSRANVVASRQLWSMVDDIICAKCAIMSAATLPLLLQQPLLLPRPLRLHRSSSATCTRTAI